MKIIEKMTYDEERALYGNVDVKYGNCAQRRGDYVRKVHGDGERGVYHRLRVERDPSEEAVGRTTRERRRLGSRISKRRGGIVHGRGMYASIYR